MRDDFGQRLKAILRDYFFATRPLSLTLALYSTTIGIVIAYHEGYLFNQDEFFLDWIKILLVTVAGLFVQTGANLINDYFECDYKDRHQSLVRYHFLGKTRTLFDISIFLLGVLAFVITGVIGLILLWLSSGAVLVVGILGIIGSYAYTGEPIVYKKRGLGTPLSFLLMGPLMIYGAYVVFAETFSWSPILIGMPISLIIPVLMLSNELRDYHRDKKLGIRTMTVRLGFKFSKCLYVCLLILSYSLVVVYILAKLVPAHAILTWLTIPLAIKSIQLIAANERAVVPQTNKLHLAFGMILILSLLYS